MSTTEYTEAILHKAKIMIGRITEDPHFGEVFKNHLFGLDGPTSLQRSLEPLEKQFQWIYRGFSEIIQSYGCLQDIEVYVQQYPRYKSFRRRSITKGKYLRYHLEKYFDEVYLLVCRLDSYIAKFSRISKLDLNDKKALLKYREAIFDSFRNITDVRGDHVHKIRFDDKELGQLSSLELICDNSKYEEITHNLEVLREMLYRDVRSKWKQKINSNNKAIKKILDSYFSLLIQVFRKYNLLPDADLRSISEKSDSR